MKNIFFLFLILAPFHFSFADEPEKTKADTNREVIRTYARVYAETGEFAKAEGLITQYMLEDAADGNLWIQLGQTQMSQKKYSQACYAFHKASEVFTDDENRIYASYQFADCLNQGNRPAEAKVLLESLAHETNDFSFAADHALELMNQGSLHSGQAFPTFQRKTRGKWRVTGAIGSGFDSNVILVDESVIQNIPVSDRGSFFVTPALQVGYLGNLFGNTFDSRYVVSYTDYLNKTAASFNSVYQRGDIAFGSGPVRWGLFADTLFLNRNPFQLYDYELGFSYLNIKKVTEEYAFTIEIPVRYQKYIIDSTTTSDNDRSGGDLQVKGNWRWMDGSDEMFAIQTILEGQYSKGKNYRLAGLDLPLTYLRSLPFFNSFGLLNTFSAEAQGQDYFQSDSSRRDLLLRGGLGLLKSMSNAWNLTVDYSYQKNLSSIETARYTKNVISLQLSHDFL